MKPKLWCIEQFNLYEKLPEAELEYLISRVEFRSAAKGEPIYFQGHPAKYVYLVHEGCVRISRILPEGKSLTLYLLGRGNLFGALQANEEERYVETAEALEETVLCIVPREVLLTLAERNPKVMLHIYKTHGSRYHHLVSHLEDLLFHTVAVRLARLFLRLADQFPARTEEGHRTVDLRLTHQDMGELIGANREVVTSTLSRFKKEVLR